MRIYIFKYEHEGDDNKRTKQKAALKRQLWKMWKSFANNHGEIAFYKEELDFTEGFCDNCH